MFDCTNENLDYDKLLTIVNTIIVTGSNGTQFSFLKWRQYIICDMVLDVTIPCKDCPHDVNGAPGIILNPGQKVQDYYRICIEGEKFLIPKQDGAIEGYLRPIEQQDFRKWKDRFWTNQPKDYKAAMKYILGRDINTGQPDIANQNEYDRIMGEQHKTDGQYFGTTAKDPEEESL
jgi:hypothetical protein